MCGGRCCIDERNHFIIGCYFYNYNFIDYRLQMVELAGE